MPDLSYESKLYAEGHAWVAGVDEAGRGPLAGPVAVAAVILPQGYEPDGLDDSKKLSAARREKLFEALTSDARVAWHCVLVEPEEIDRVNILRATHLGMRRAAEGLAREGLALLIDGNPVPGLPWPSRSLVKGDGLSCSIAAASIIAKVTRDRLMMQLAERYPGYGFEAHKGYGTAQHLAALRRLGPCPAHRRSFAPVSQMELEL
ncbi:MAG: ribonuclease HII [Verrucomicrobiales bacterium]|nr:ribonuclease HII [Verrucomicrobiales bacterium]